MVAFELLRKVTKMNEKLVKIAGFAKSQELQSEARDVKKMRELNVQGNVKGAEQYCLRDSLDGVQERIA